MTPLDQLRQLVAGHTSEDDERQILALMRDATTGDLEEMVLGVDTGELFSSMDDRVLGPDLRAELRELLARTRAPELTALARARVVYGLQVGRTDHDDEIAIRDVFRSARGDDLTALKNQVNMRVDSRDLEGLLFRDIDDEDIRREILDHIAAEAPSSTPARTGEAKILSDIDDTAFARIHETRYPKGTLVPGILALYQVLDDGPHGTPASTGDLTFVTARPTDALGLIENHTRSALRKAGIADHSVLTGNFLSLRSHDDMADKKIENIAHYSKLFPEYALVFIGDSGQGDILVGEAIYAAHPEAVKAVFIHDVKALPPERRAELGAKGIHVVDTYVGAAAKARDLGLVSAEGAARVLAETLSGLDTLAWESTEQERTMRGLVARDAEAGGIPASHA